MQGRVARLTRHVCLVALAHEMAHAIQDANVCERQARGRDPAWPDGSDGGVWVDRVEEGDSKREEEDDEAEGECDPVCRYGHEWHQPWRE